MNRNFDSRNSKNSEKKSVQRRWKKFTSCMAIMISFMVMYALILPATAESAGNAGDNESGIVEVVDNPDSTSGEGLDNADGNDGEVEPALESEGEGGNKENGEPADEENKEETADSEPTGGEQNEDEDGAEEQIALLDDDIPVDDGPVEGQTESLNPYINDISVGVDDDTTTEATYTATYSDDKKTFKIYFTMEFTIQNPSRTKEYTFVLPKEVVVPELTSKYTGKDNNYNDAFNFWFVENTDADGTADGTYTIHMKFLDSYNIEGAQEVTGYIRFWGEATTESLEDNGEINIKFEDLTDYTVTIPTDKISYPDDVTSKYHIGITKSNGTYDAANKTLTYTSTIYSKKGTPAPIAVSDELTITNTNTTTDLPISVTDVQISSVQIGSFTTGDDGTINKEDDKEDLESRYMPVITDDNKNLSTVNTASFGFELPALEGNKIYYITYVLTLSPPKKFSCTVKNTITATATDTTTSEKVTATADSTTTLDISILAKSGDYDASKKYISWVIDVNKAKENIYNLTLTDTMFDKVSGNITVTRDGTTIYESSGEYKIMKDDDGVIQGIVFLAGEDNANCNTYKVTYKTQHNSSFTKYNIKNVAELGEGIGYAERVVQIPAATDSAAGKQLISQGRSDADGIFTMKWWVYLPIPEGEIPATTEFSDEAQAYNTSNGSWKYDKSLHWFTADQIIEWLNAYKEAGYFDWTKEGSVSIVLYTSPSGLQGLNKRSATIIENDDGYDIYIDGNKMASDYIYCGIKVTLNEPVTVTSNSNETTKYIFYTTTGCDKNVADKFTYYNKFTAGAVDKKGQFARTKYVVKLNGDKTDANQDVVITSENVNDDDSKYLYWYVRIKPNDGSTNFDYLKVTDTLPEGVTLSGIGVGTLMDDAKANLDQTLPTGVEYKVDNSNGICNVITTVKSAYTNTSEVKENNQFYICYKCEVDGNLKDLDLASYDNSVTVTAVLNDSTNSEEFYGSDDSKETIKLQKVTKTGEWDEDNKQMKYSLKINPLALDLVKDSDKLSLTDTLTYTLNTTDGLSVTLDYDSVKLYKVIDGKNILCNSSDWVWTASTGFASNNTKATRTISATVDDETSYVLEYAYTVDYEKIPSSSTVTKTTTMDNTVRLYSDNSASTSNSTESKWSQSGASGGINSTYFSYTFTKVQSGNYGNQLEGAIFGLYYLNGSPVVDTDGTDITYTTDSKGKFVISKTDLLTTDTVYYVKEIKPPVGYKIPDDAQSYYFYFKENGLADSAPTGTVDLSSASQAVSVPNALIPTYELPETGGTGRHRGLAVGIALIAASTILLWRRKKNPSSWI